MILWGKSFLSYSWRIGGMLGTGQWMSEWVSEWEMDVHVFHTNQIGSATNKPIKFLVFAAGTCNMILWFVLNGNLKLLFFSYKWLQLKLTNQWLLFTLTCNQPSLYFFCGGKEPSCHEKNIGTPDCRLCSHGQNKQTRSQSSGTSRKSVDLSFLNVFSGTLIFYINGNS